MKKIALLAFIFFIIPQHSRAQFDIESFKTPAQQMVENAVKPTLVFICSSFQIRNNETGMLYGLNGQKEFGEQVSYGIKTRGGIFLNDYAVFPWKYNEKFPKYSNEYSPVLSSMQYSEIKDSANYDSLDINITELQVLNDSSFFYSDSKTFDGEGLIIDNTLGEKNGWLLWITIQKDVDVKKSTNINMITQQKNIEISKKGDSFVIAPPKTTYNIIGGVYVIPSYRKIGSVDFYIAGVLTYKEKEWKLLCPFHDLEKVAGGHTKKNEATTINNNSEELTPISGIQPSGQEKKSRSKKRKS